MHVPTDLCLPVISVDTQQKRRPYSFAEERPGRSHKAYRLNQIRLAFQPEEVPLVMDWKLFAEICGKPFKLSGSGRSVQLSLLTHSLSVPYAKGNLRHRSISSAPQKSLFTEYWD